MNKGNEKLNKKEEERKNCFPVLFRFLFVGVFLFAQDKVGTVQLQNHFPCILLEVASDELQLLDPAEGSCRQDLQII